MQDNCNTLLLKKKCAHVSDLETMAKKFHFICVLITWHSCDIQNIGGKTIRFAAEDRIFTTTFCAYNACFDELIRKQTYVYENSM